MLDQAKERTRWSRFLSSDDEAAALRSQSATSSAGHGGRRYAPYVFTEQGVAMLSGVLQSKTAIACLPVDLRALGLRVDRHDRGLISMRI
jgi:ORF6N domain